MNFEKIKKNLEKNGFKVSCFENSKQAVEYLDRQIDGKTVGMGGSVTLDQIGLYDSLCTHNDVNWHQRKPSDKTAEQVNYDARQSQIYISSVNGIAESGEIITIDGRGNRVSAVFYGAEKVYLVVGINKIAADYDAALWRARNIAAPLNAKRLGRNTPCAKNADRCYNCSSPERICRGLTVLWKKPTGAEYEVVLINEKLGY